MMRCDQMRSRFSPGAKRVVHWLPRSSALPELMDVLNREAFVGLRSFDLQLARYGPGAKYVRHRDAFPGQGNRRVTAIVYLNEGWVPAHGGELKLFDPEMVIEPVMDRLVVFLSEKIEHEVLESRAETVCADRLVLALTLTLSPRWGEGKPLRFLF